MRDLFQEIQNKKLQAINNNFTQDIEKAASVPVGTIRARGNQNWIKTPDGWKYHGLVQATRHHHDNPTHDTNRHENHDETSSHENNAAPAHHHTLESITAALSKENPVEALVESGFNDASKIVELTGANLSDVLTHMESKGVTPGNVAMNISSLKNKLPKVPVKERWDAYRLFLGMVADGMSKSAIAYGSGGVGKTYNLKESFAQRRLREYRPEYFSGGSDYDFIKITGKATPTHLFKTLYEHNGKIVVFDDCDSVLEDKTAVNILKGALDSTGDGTIDYGSRVKLQTSEGEDIPQRFAFSGRVVFISNLTADKMPQPLRSRALTIDLTMTADETIEVMRDVIQQMPFQDNNGNPIDVSREDRKAAIDFLAEVKDKVPIDDLNARTLGQIALIKKRVSALGQEGMNWKTVARAMLT